MPSSYTSNAGFEKPADGEQNNSWGDTVNDNMDILDRLTSQVGSIALVSTTYTLTTSTSGAVSEGHYSVIKFTGSPGGTCTVTISPNSVQRIYTLYNASDQTVTMTQGSGGNVSIAAGAVSTIYCDGAGSGAAVVDIGELPQGLGVGDSPSFLSLTASGGVATFGVSDATRGIVQIHGNGSGSTLGGELRVFSAADYDTTVNYWRLWMDGDTLKLNATGVGDGLRLNASQEATFPQTATFSKGLIVDTSTLVVDEVNNRVGIGTSSPSHSLTVNGSLATTGLYIDGSQVSSTAAELNILDGVTATTAELNILDGVTATTAEINYVSGVTSAIQTQLDAKAASTTQDQATWEAGTGTTETVVSPAKVKAAIEALAPASFPAPDYESAELTVNNGAGGALAHGLGVIPSLIKVVAVCKTGEDGYTAGMEVDISNTQPTWTSGTPYSVGVVVAADATNITYIQGATQAFGVLNLSTGSNAFITEANWPLVIRAWA